MPNLVYAHLFFHRHRRVHPDRDAAPLRGHLHRHNRSAAADHQQLRTARHGHGSNQRHRPQLHRPHHRTKHLPGGNRRRPKLHPAGTVQPHRGRHTERHPHHHPQRRTNPRQCRPRRHRRPAADQRHQPQLRSSRGSDHDYRNQLRSHPGQRLASPSVALCPISFPGRTRRSPSPCPATPPPATSSSPPAEHPATASPSPSIPSPPSPASRPPAVRAALR